MLANQSCFRLTGVQCEINLMISVQFLLDRELYDRPPPVLIGTLFANLTGQAKVLRINFTVGK